MRMREHDKLRQTKNNKSNHLTTRGRSKQDYVGVCIFQRQYTLCDLYSGLLGGDADHVVYLFDDVSVADMAQSLKQQAASKCRNAVTGEAKCTGAEPELGQQCDAGVSLLVRHLPPFIGQHQFLEFVRAAGMLHLLNFVYVPAKFGTGRSFGYAMVSCISETAKVQLSSAFSAADGWPSSIAIEYNKNLGSLSDLIERYRNSPIMLEHMSDEQRPMLFQHGVRIPFPAPTGIIPPTRRRGRRHPASKAF